LVICPAPKPWITIRPFRYQANLFIQRAENEKDKQKGLGDKPCIGPSEAMLFVFDKPGSYSFWAKDMQFAIDIIWLSADKKVVYRQLNVQPSSNPQSFTNQPPAKYVLELNAGRANYFGLTEGNQLSF